MAKVSRLFMICELALAPNLTNPQRLSGLTNFAFQQCTRTLPYTLFQEPCKSLVQQHKQKYEQIYSLRLIIECHCKKVQLSL